MLSSADLRSVLDVEAQRQAAGCSEASCLAEIAGAVGARFFAAVEVNKLGAGLRAQATLTDTKSIEVKERIEIESDNAASLAAKLPAAAARLVGAALVAEGVVASGPWAWDAHVARLHDTIGADAYQRARFLVLAGDLEGAAAVGAKIKDASKRKIVDGNLALVKAERARAYSLTW